VDGEKFVFNATEQIQLVIMSESSTSGIITIDALNSFIANADVCKLSLTVDYLYLSPPLIPSELCAAVLQWRERAELLRVALSTNATCGAHFASWELGQLQLLEERLGALPPADTMAACLQASCSCSTLGCEPNLASCGYPLAVHSLSTRCPLATHSLLTRYSLATHLNFPSTDPLLTASC
jgi:hypothetical protein